MKKITAWVLTLVLALAITGLGIAEEAAVQAILDKGTFILGLDDSFPPMGYQDEAGEIVGFDIDVALEVCVRLGVELVKQPIDWAAKEIELAGGNIDCIWNGMSITPARQESMSMTFPYLNNQMVFYVLKDSGIAALEDLAGKKVAVQSGSYAEEIINGDDCADLKASFADVLSFDDYLTALMDLEMGGVDAVLSDKVVAEFKIAGMGSDKIIPTVTLEDDEYGVGFRKEDGALRDKVESILLEMKKDGTLGEISAKWFGSDITTVPAE